MTSNRLKDLRNSTGMSQREFANVLGVAQQTVGSWETGRTEPSNDVIRDIANKFGVTTDYLLGNDLSPKYYLEKDETKILDGYRNLDDESKQLVASMIERLNFNSQPTVMRMTAI